MAINNPEALWLLVAIPVFFAVCSLLNLLSRRDISRFAHQELYNALTRSISKTKRRIRSLLFLVGMIFLILSLTDPRFGTKTEVIKFWKD